MPRMSYRPEEIIAKLRQAAIQILPLSGGDSCEGVARRRGVGTRLRRQLD